MIKSKFGIWANYNTHTHTQREEKRHAYKQLFGKLQGMRSLGTPTEIVKYII